MSWLSNATGIHLGNIGAPIGAALGSVIPGVGTAIGAALGGGLGSLGSGKSAGQALATGAGDYALGQGAQSIAGLLGGGDNASSAIPDSAMGGDAGGSGILGTLEGLAGKAGSFLTGNNGLNLLGAAQGVSSVLDQKKASDLANQALNTTQSAYNAKAPLRTQGIQGLLSPQTPNLSNLQGIASSLKAPTLTAQPISQFTAPQRTTPTAGAFTDPGNPYAQARTN